MSNAHPNLLTRDDTFFGVCEALGQDLGFNPIYLRAALGVLLLWNPVVVLVAYAGAAVVVLLSRLIFPTRHPTKAAEEALVPAAQRLQAVNDAKSMAMAQAA